MSADDSFAVDPALLQDFLVESREALDGLDELFVQLESRPDDLGLIDAIFRPVHSVKGNSSFFGLVNIKNFSHGLENLLQELRNKTLRAHREVIDILLRGVDMLTAMFERLAAGDTDTALRPDEEALLQEAARVREGGGVAPSADVLMQARSVLAGVRDRMPESLQSCVAGVDEALERIIAELAADGEGEGAGEADDGVRYRVGDEDVSEAVRTARRFVREIGDAQRDDEAVASFLAALGTLSTAAGNAQDKRLSEAVAALRSDFESIHSSGIGFDDLLASIVQEKLDAVLGGLKREAGAAGAVPPQPDARPAETTGTKPPAEAAPAERPAAAGEDAMGKTIRVAEEKVDAFMHYVGELIITSEVLNYIQKRLERADAVRDIAGEFKKAVLAFNELSFDLQRSLMAVRRVPIKGILQKLPRTVRDLSQELGKQIELEMDGQLVQIDKSLVEALEAPVTHMVRNAVDHAIEMPEERRKAGKPETGHVHVSAECDEETFTLRISDDGRGLDVDALKAKAVEKGTLSEAEADAMSRQDAFRLIFGAGVSTAKKVTDVSGRGVGMDVVRSNIEGVNGTIDIESELGVGSTFTITLPMTVTLLVVDGLLAQVGETTYIVPVVQVLESIRPTREQISTVRGRGEMLNARGTLFPIVRLHRLFGVEAVHENPWDTVVVLVSDGESSCALLVDELLGQQSVVLKDLTDYFAGLDILRGGAILGNGKVGLVLDVEALIAATGGAR